MKSMIIVSILITILIKSAYAQMAGPYVYELTSLENDARKGSCGDPKGELLWVVRIFGFAADKAYQRIRDDLKSKFDEKYTFNQTEEPLSLNSTTSPSTLTTSSGTTQTFNWTTTVPTSDPGTSTTAGNIFDELKLNPDDVQNISYTTGVLVSKKHVLTSSSFFIFRNKSGWHFKTSGKRINDSECEENQQHFSFSDPFYIRDSLDRKMSAKDVTFLNYCVLKRTAVDFVTVLVLNEDSFPNQAVCLPRSRFKVNVGDLVNFTGHFGDDPLRKAGNVANEIKYRQTKIQECETSNSSELICTMGVSCMRHAGAPLVKRVNGIDTLVGIAITEKCDPIAQDTFHNIKTYVESLCGEYNVCNKDMVGWGLTEKEPREIYKTIEDDYFFVEPEPDIVPVLGSVRRVLFELSLLIPFLVVFGGL